MSIYRPFVMIILSTFTCVMWNRSIHSMVLISSVCKSVWSVRAFGEKKKNNQKKVNAAGEKYFFQEIIVFDNFRIKFQKGNEAKLYFYRNWCFRKCQKLILINIVVGIYSLYLKLKCTFFCCNYHIFLFHDICK